MLDINKQSQKEDVKEVRKKEQEKKVEKLFTFVPHKGHKMYSINNITGEIKLAKFEMVDYVIGEKRPNQKIMVEKDCLYLGALNLKNLYKKLSKQFPDRIEELKQMNNYGK